VSPDSKISGRATGPSGAQFASAGLQFAAAIVGFMFLGIWLDRRLGTSPWLLILFVFLGAGGGFYSLYRQLTAAQRRSNAERASGGPSGGGGGQR
jgi:F0F1-type ATP synthase assembly protein I